MSSFLEGMVYSQKTTGKFTIGSLLCSTCMESVPSVMNTSRIDGQTLKKNIQVKKKQISLDMGGMGGECGWWWWWVVLLSLGGCKWGWWVVNGW